MCFTLLYLSTGQQELASIIRHAKEPENSGPPLMSASVLGAHLIVAVKLRVLRDSDSGCALAFQRPFSHLISSFDKMSVFKTSQEGQKIHDHQEK